MKKLIYILVLVMLGGIVNAQSSTLSKKEQRQLLKEEKKRFAAEEAEMRLVLTTNMVKTGRFVLEADIIYDKYGQNIQVESAINFISCDSINAVIQIGNSFGLGSNGVGGVTIEGRIEKYTYKLNEKRRTYTVNFDVRSPNGLFSVILNTMSGSRSDASVTGTLTNGMIRFSGNLVYPTESRVYKGTSFY